MPKNIAILKLETNMLWKPTCYNIVTWSCPMLWPGSIFVLPCFVKELVKNAANNMATRKKQHGNVPK
jgi:hypothetical protein